MKNYKVNEKFPIPNSAPNFDNVRSDINSQFINIISNLTSPTLEEIKAWGKGSFRYGVFVESDIPFFLLDFGDMELDASVNILKLTNQSLRDLWLSINGGWLNMFLVDAHTNILKSMRTIYFNRTDKIKQTLQKQV